MCRVCLDTKYDYICPTCKSHDSGVCKECYRPGITCPFCKCRVEKEWMVNMTFQTIIYMYKSLHMYRLGEKTKYNINEMSVRDLETLILHLDSYIRHHFDYLPHKSQNIIALVRKKITIVIGNISYVNKHPIPILKDPYQRLPSE